MSAIGAVQGSVYPASSHLLANRWYSLAFLAGGGGLPFLVLLRISRYLARERFRKLLASELTAHLEAQNRVIRSGGRPADAPKWEVTSDQAIEAIRNAGKCIAEVGELCGLSCNTEESDLSYSERMLAMLHRYAQRASGR